MNFSRLNLLAAALAVFSPFAAAQSPSSSSLDARLEPLINRTMAANKIPGLALGVVKDGKLVYAKGFGVSRLGDTKPITTRTLFHMASVTKTFVATSIMQLVEQGKIELDHPLVEYLPYFKMKDERFRSITIRQMLSHTSGIPDVTGYNWDKPEYDDKALERFVRSVHDWSLVSAPGEKFGYSNTAFEILGDVIAKVSGQSFEDYVQQHILSPLGMKESTLLVRNANPELLAAPHVKKEGEVVVSQVFPYNRAHAPSSTLDSSIEDMSRWAMANLNRGELDGKRILKASTYEVLWKPVVQTRSAVESAKVGVSWFIQNYGGHRIVLHNGGDVGFTSTLLLAPDDSIAVVAMSNYLPSNACYVCELGNAALKMMLGLDSEAAKPAPAESFDRNAAAKTTLDEVLAKYVEALGGKAAIEKITSRVSNGTFEVEGVAFQGAARIYEKAPDKRALVLEAAAQEAYRTGFDGVAGWQEDPDNGVTDVKGAALNSMRRDSEFYRALKLRESYPRVELKGGMRIGNRDTIVLEAPRGGNPKRWYFDVESGLLVRTDERSAAGTVTRWEEFDNYKAVDGVKVPFKIRSFDEEVITINFTEIKQNVPIEDGIFRKPTGK